MLAKKIEDYGSINKESIIAINQNEYIFFERQKNDDIIGLYTDGLVTCSSIIISFNDQEYIFFAHIDEDSNIIQVIKEDIINRIFNKNIKKIEINYSKGINSIKNIKIDYDHLIVEIISLFKTSLNKTESLTINKSFKAHSSTISCLKIFNTLNFEKIKNYQLNAYEREKNKNKIGDFKKSFLKSSLDTYKQNIDSIYNIIYYYDYKSLQKVLTVLELDLIPKIY